MADKRAGGGVGFEGVTPILRVENLAASVEYYVSKLGFKMDWGESGGFTSVSRGKCHIFLSERDQGHTGSWVWIGVEDAEALLDEYRASGAKVRHPPTNYPWTYEMQVEDLDGNVLRMGSDPKSDQPPANGSTCTGDAGYRRRVANLFRWRTMARRTRAIRKTIVS